MGASRHWQGLALIACLLGPADAGWVEHTPYTVNEVYIGCQALLERRFNADMVTECHLTFQQGGTFDQWSTKAGRPNCRSGQTVESLAYRYVSATGRFLMESDDDMRLHAGAKPASTLFDRAFGTLCTG
jgi:hypothetical protein